VGGTVVVVTFGSAATICRAAQARQVATDVVAFFRRSPFIVGKKVVIPEFSGVIVGVIAAREFAPA
jgi:hypothetical protein